MGSLLLPVASQDQPEKSIGGDDSRTLPSMDVPVVDLGLLLTPPSSTSAVQELEKLFSALTSFGCLQVINHGIDIKFLDEVHEVGRQFFRLPPEEKEKYSKESDGLKYEVHGYRDELIGENKTPEWSHRMNMLVFPEDQRLLKFWPQYPPIFSKTLHEYGIKLQVITEIIVKAMARSLNLNENGFLDMLGERPRLVARFNFYPPCPENSDQILSFKAHADASLITTVLPDREVEGLQIFNDNQWCKVTILPQAFLINVGDQGQIMSNGIFKSPVHRVVTNSTRERISVAMFSVPSRGKEIGPVDGLIGDRRPRLYRNLVDYAEDFYFQHYWRGLCPIEAAKI